MPRKWFEFIEMAIPRPPKVPTKIQVRSLGIQKVVIVRTRGNNSI